MGSSFVALIGVLLIFWDAIPTSYTHYRLCSDEGGLVVYQTPDAWAAEHPEEFLKVLSKGGEKFIASKGTLEYTPSEVIYRKEIAFNFVREVRTSKGFDYGFNNRRHKEVLIFKPTQQVLFEAVDFFGAAGDKSLASGADSFGDYKFWTVTGSCERVSKAIADKFLTTEALSVIF